LVMKNRVGNGGGVSYFTSIGVKGEEKGTKTFHDHFNFHLERIWEKRVRVGKSFTRHFNSKL